MSVNKLINQLESEEKISIKNNTEKAKEVWDKCKSIIRQSVNALAFKTWFEPIVPIDFQDSNLTVSIPYDFNWDYIEMHYSTLIKKALLNVIGENAKLSYKFENTKNLESFFTEKIDNHIENQEIKNVVSPEQTNNLNYKLKTNSQPVTKEEYFETYLNDKFSFDNFIKGESNQLARAAAIAVAEAPGYTSFNPLFIYGGVGLGKTHLIQAIGNYVVANKKANRVLYTTAEKFTTEFVESIKKGNTNDFTNFYKSIDLLIIDDIQFFSGKESTTDTFFHIFNSLYHLGKQIVLSCDKPPKSLSGLDERLISRFQWGLSVDIQPPDLETRIAILIKKCESFNLEIDLNIIEYIATNITNNIRELEGALIKILATASLEKKEITLDLAREVVKSVATEKKSNLSIEQIQRIVAEFFEIDPNMLRAKTKKKEYVQARQIAMYFCKKLTNSSLKTIGINFGGRDHSTVIHAIQSVEEAMKDNSFVDLLSSIQRKIEYNS